MGFTKAKPQQGFLKMGMYGPQGSGKTFTSLLFAEGLLAGTGKRIAFVDTERGTDFYAQAVQARKVHPEAFDFDALYTSSLAEVTDALKSIRPEEHGCIVIDSISHLWDAAINAYGGNRTKIDTIPLQAWGRIKRPYKALIRALLDYDGHVFILGREKNVFEKDERGDLTKVGVAMRAEGETEYEPHICVRMEREIANHGGLTIRMCVEKDRSGVLMARVFDNPTFAVLEPLLPLLTGGAQAKSDDPDDVAAADAELLDGTEKAAAKEEVSRGLFSGLNSKIVGAESLDTLAGIAAEIKTSKKKMLEQHVIALREAYNTRHAALSTKAAPVFVE